MTAVVSLDELGATLLELARAAVLELCGAWDRSETGQAAALRSLTTLRALRAVAVRSYASDAAFELGAAVDLACAAYIGSGQWGADKDSAELIERARDRYLGAAARRREVRT